MAAGKLNILIEQGATFNRILTVKGDNDTPLNLTGKTLRGQLRYHPNDATAALTFTFTLANQTTNPGVVTWSATATATDLLTKTQAVYDVELVDGASVTRLLEGQAFISLAVTKA